MSIISQLFHNFSKTGKMGELPPLSNSTLEMDKYSIIRFDTAQEGRYFYSWQIEVSMEGSEVLKPKSPKP
jgi:hypothetical protein